jgi:hypothetical protein
MANRYLKLFMRAMYWLCSSVLLARSQFIYTRTDLRGAQIEFRKTSFRLLLLSLHCIAAGLRQSPRQDVVLPLI